MSNDPYKYFRTEARELVERLMQGALDLEKGRGDQDLVAQLLRHAHTLKGAARIVEQARISELSHAIEEVLAGLRENPGAISSAHMRQFLCCIDEITALLAAIDAAPAGGPSSAANDFSAAGETAAALGAEPPEDRAEHLRVDAAEMDALLQAIAEVRIHLSAMEQQTQTIGEVVHLGGLPLVEAGPRSLAAADKSLREVHRAMEINVQRAARDLDRLYEQASEMRLVPARSVFAALERAVRDAADALGKRVEFVAAGGDTRLDAYALQLLRSALIHLVRNAVAHGIESQFDRRLAGKPPLGRVELEIRRRGDQALLVCRDDGCGIDLDRARQTLLAHGLVTPAEAPGLTGDTAMALLLRGGITTKHRATELCGRGIGLDVVRQTVSTLKGSVTAQAAPGQGTTVTISVPVSIESLDVLHVETGGLVVSIPFQAVRKALRLRADEVARSAQGESIVCDGQVLPLVSLAGILQRKTGVRGGLRPVTALVLDADSITAAVEVEHLVGRQRVVVHALPPMLGCLPAVSGAFFDSQGDPQLVLDPVGLVHMAKTGGLPAAEVAPAVKPPLLVIDDSLTTRMLEQGILEAAGYEVDTASSAEEALQMAHQRAYGVFIVDVEMPGMNGFEFIETARSNTRFGHVPSVLVTSRDSDQDRARGDRAGARAYIIKSRFDEGLLLDTIRNLIG